MIRSLILSAAAAGLAAGIVGATLQHFLTTPIILDAEIYESRAGSLHHHDVKNGASQGTPAETPQPDATAAHSHDAEAWAPATGMERAVYTSISTILLAVGYGLVILAAMIVFRVPISARNGVAFGAAGFVAMALAPSLGLPPELPGAAVADLAPRQLWWAMTAAATALGLAALFLGKSRWLRLAGLVALVVPHLVGAPHPDAFAGSAPGELSGQFATASLAVAAVVWAVVGFVAGAVHKQLAPAAAD